MYYHYHVNGPKICVLHTTDVSLKSAVFMKDYGCTLLEHFYTHWIEISLLTSFKNTAATTTATTTTMTTTYKGKESTFTFYIVRANCVSTCTFVVSHLSSSTCNFCYVHTACVSVCLCSPFASRLLSSV